MDAKDINLTLELTLPEVNLVLNTLDEQLKATPFHKLIEKIREQGEPQVKAFEKANEESNTEPV